MLLNGVYIKLTIKISPVQVLWITKLRVHLQKQPGKSLPSIFPMPLTKCQHDQQCNSGPVKKRVDRFLGPPESTV